MAALSIMGECGQGILEIRNRAPCEFAWLLNSTLRLRKRPLENSHASLWILNFWLPKDAPAGRAANQLIASELAESGLHLHLMQNKVHYFGQLGFNYHQVYCQVEHYAP